MVKDMEHPILNFWSWNDAITQPELEAQLREFAAGRFDGVVIHARAGLGIAYLGEEWFRLYECALKTARELSLDVWIYDEDGWPSGFAGGRVPAMDPTYHLKRLHYGFEPPEGGKGTLIAAYRETTQDGYRQIPCEQARHGDLFFWYTSESAYVDLLLPEVTRAFLDVTHERYYRRFASYFGNTVKGFFTDEPQLGVPLPWSTQMSAAYEAFTGRPLLPSLWLLAVKGEGYRRFRADYFSAANAQLKSSFTDQISQWCAAHQVEMTGHFACEDGLGMQVGANGGVMAQYPSMQLPGVDHLGNRAASPTLLKQASSASLQFGSGEVLSETFGCSGWDVSFAELAWLWGRQVALGVTAACCHLSAYSIKGRRKRDYPAFFSYQSSWWSEFPALTAWMSALSRFMGEGAAEAEILVLSPLSTVVSEYDGSYRSDRLRECATQYRCLLQNLLDVQLEFEIGDEALIRRAGSVENNRFLVGKRSYHTIFVADCDSLCGVTARLLQRFSDNGGSVFFVNRRPAMVDFIPSGLPRQIGGNDISNRRELLEKTVRAFGLSRYAVLRGREHEEPCTHVIVRTSAVLGGRRIQLCNNSRVSGVKGLLEIDDTVAVSSFDCLTGRTQPLACRRAGGKTYVELTLEPMGNAALETRRNTAPSIQRPPLCGRQYLTPQKVYRTQKNCLTVDCAALTIGEEKLGVMPVIHMTELLYARAAAAGSAEAQIRYSFQMGRDCPKEGMRLCLEGEGVTGIFVNGSPVSAQAQGWWLCRCIREYDISSFVQTGENTVCLTYRITAGRILKDGEGFETQQNRFCYPIEPESIYIRGDFDVEAPDYEDNGYSYRVSRPEFLLTASQPKSYGELTRQGLWFYRGCAELEFRIEKPMGKKAYLSVDRLNCPAACWRLGSASGVILSSGQPVELTEYLEEGGNLLRLRLVSGNRNLLGPHHHVKARPPLVGPHTFAGVLGFEDFVSPELQGESTWTQAYSFVPFGCEGVHIDVR